MILGHQLIFSIPTYFEISGNLSGIKDNSGVGPNSHQSKQIEIITIASLARNIYLTDDVNFHQLFAPIQPQTVNINIRSQKPNSH